MRCRSLTSVLPAAVIAAAIAISAFAAADSQALTDSPTLTAQDGVVEAHADALANILRIRRSGATDARSLSQKACAIVPAQLSWIDRVQVYPPETVDVAQTTVAAEADQRCRESTASH